METSIMDTVLNDIVPFGNLDQIFANFSQKSSEYIRDSFQLLQQDQFTEETMFITYWYYQRAYVGSIHRYYDGVRILHIVLCNGFRYDGVPQSMMETCMQKNQKRDDAWIKVPKKWIETMPTMECFYSELSGSKPELSSSKPELWYNPTEKRLDFVSLDKDLQIKVIVTFEQNIPDPDLEDK